MENVNLLKLADGQLMPQEGFGLYKITDQSTITSSIRNAYNCILQVKSAEKCNDFLHSLAAHFLFYLVI